MWASYLENSIKGEAANYIGSKGKWFNNYDGLWATLDDKYANRWVLASETIRQFFNRENPEATQTSVDRWFYEQLDCMKSILDLGLTAEQIMVNVMTQVLPEEYANEIRQGLRNKYPDRDRSNFTGEEIRAVYNDTIAIRNIPLTTSQIPISLQHSVQVNKNPKNQSNRKGKKNKSGYNGGILKNNLNLSQGNNQGGNPQPATQRR